MAWGAQRPHTSVFSGFPLTAHARMYLVIRSRGREKPAPPKMPQNLFRKRGAVRSQRNSTHHCSAPTAWFLGSPQLCRRITESVEIKQAPLALELCGVSGRNSPVLLLFKARIQPCPATLSTSSSVVTPSATSFQPNCASVVNSPCSMTFFIAAIVGSCITTSRSSSLKSSNS